MNQAGFEYPFQVRLHDTDAAGVLFFAHLFRHAHDAYEAFMAQAGLDLAGMLAHGELRLPLVHAEADYLAPIRHGDALLVQLDLERRGAGSFTLGYRFLDGEGVERARARTVHAALDPAFGQPVALPESLLRVLARLTPV